MPSKAKKPAAKKAAPKKRTVSEAPVRSSSVNVRTAANGFIVSQWDEKTGREATYIAKTRKELTEILGKVGL